MATEHEHIERAEVLAQRADNAITPASQVEMGSTELAYRKAEVLAQMAAARAQLACARALTADTADQPRPARTSRQGIDLSVTKIGDRP